MCNFSIKPSIDIFNAEKYLAPNVNLKLKFLRSDPSFGIIKHDSTNEYIVKITSLKLQMWKMMPTTFTRDQFYKRLALKEAQMAFKSSKIRSYHIARGESNVQFPNICNGTLPKAVLVALVDAGAFSGVNQSDPFYYDNFNLGKINLQINGQNHLPTPLEPNFATGKDLIELYRHFNDNTGILHGNNSNGITFENFKKGSTILAFDLNPGKF